MLIQMQNVKNAEQGTLLKHIEEHLLQSDLRQTDVIFYYTTVRIAVKIVIKQV